MNELKLKDEIKKRLKKHKLFFENHAELGNQEYETARYIKKCLLSLGYVVEDINSSTGIIASLEHNTKNRKCLFFRAEMDALPVENNIVKHACGHDSHMAVMLSLAEEIAGYSNLKIDVVFLFQPAEELCNGAKKLIEHEIFNKYNEKNILGFHMWADLPYCSCALVKGNMMAGGGQFKIEIEGSAAHGAFPYLGKDSVVIAAEVIIEIQSIISRQTNPLDSAVITVGTINGGIADNQIPTKTTITGTIRYLSKQTKNRIIEYIKNICKSKKVKWNVEIEFTFKERVFLIENDEKLIEIISEDVIEVFGKEAVISDYRTMAVDDFSEYMKTIPGIYLLVGCQNKEQYPQHHPQFYVDEYAMEKAYELVSKLFLKLNEVKK